MTDKIKEGTLAVAEEFAKDLNAELPKVIDFAETLPGFGTLLKASSLCVAIYENRKFNEFIQSLMIAHGYGSFTTMRDHIERHSGKRWMEEGFASGWRLGMETMDDEARRCAYLMVADYMLEQKRPDIVYRRLGGVFKDSDLTMLKQYERIATFFKDNGYKESRIVFAKKDPTELGDPGKIMMVCGENMVPILSDVIEECADALIRNSLSSFSRGGGGSS